MTLYEEIEEILNKGPLAKVALPSTQMNQVKLIFRKICERIESQRSGSSEPPKKVQPSFEEKG